MWAACCSNPCVFRAQEHRNDGRLLWTLVGVPPLRVESTSWSSGQVAPGYPRQRARVVVSWQGHPPPFDDVIDGSDPRYGAYNGELSPLPAAGGGEAAGGQEVDEQQVSSEDEEAGEARQVKADQVLILDMNHDLGVEAKPMKQGGQALPSTMVFRKVDQQESPLLSKLQGQWHGHTSVQSGTACLSTFRGLGRCALTQGRYGRSLVLGVHECETKCLQTTSCRSYSFKPGECFLFSSECRTLETTSFAKADDLLVYETYAMATAFPHTSTCDVDLLVQARSIRIDVSNCEGAGAAATAPSSCRISPQQGSIEGILQASEVCPEGNARQTPPCVLQDYETRFIHYEYYPFFVTVVESYNGLQPKQTFSGVFTFNTRVVASMQVPPRYYPYHLSMYMPHQTAGRTLIQLSDVVHPFLEQPSSAQVLNLYQRPAGYTDGGRSWTNLLEPLAADTSMQQQQTIDYELQLYFECNASITRFIRNESWALRDDCSAMVLLRSLG